MRAPIGWFDRIGFCWMRNPCVCLCWRSRFFARGSSAIPVFADYRSGFCWMRKRGSGASDAGFRADFSVTESLLMFRLWQRGVSVT